MRNGVGIRPGRSEAELRIPPELVAPLQQLATDMGVSLGSVWLAAHARVLATLSGQREASTGYVAKSGGRPLALRMPVAQGSWRSLVLEAHRAERELPADARARFATHAGDAGLAKPPSFEALFDPTGTGGGLLEHTRLRTDILKRNGFVLRTELRTDASEARTAARVAGYHLAALAAIAADPDAEHGRQCLLSREEVDFQLHGLAGPSRRLPDCPIHELFEIRARAHPDAVAAAHGGRAWTYRELNGRANQVARALLARGLHREDVVAVVTERDLDWVAAVLGIFKAGGAYLPIGPGFPSERIARMLARARCRLVVSERGGAPTLDRALEALPEAQSLHLDAVPDERHDDRDIGERVTLDQLACVFFTSGSAGEPKGVMCEHAGLLNHLFAKVLDLGIGSGDVVAQTAPLGFDISLWQLLSPLLAGGRALLVEQEVVADPARFLEWIASARVTLFQVVPSLLEVLVSHLDLHPCRLPHLRCVTATGEVLKKELVQRWFALQPAIRLVNVYGLTETSDGTHHEIMDRPPDAERVPLGRPIQNVRVYVVDEHLSPVPLGAPGEIVFSGVCVARGYINDPARTRRAFPADPHRTGERLYGSGDYGRWLPDGRLEFLGRREARARASGLRIEIGRIEEALTRLPGIHSGAVMVAGRTGRSRRLVAFYSADRPLGAGRLSDRLGETLPACMVPSAFHWRRTLPLTRNGKIDRRALAMLAGEVDGDGPGRQLVMTATERRLAAAWADVLGVSCERIAPGDDFFDLGGTSLSAVKLVIRLDRVVGLKDLARHPVLAELATVIDAAADRRTATGPR